MAIVASILFVAAGIAAAATIWYSVGTAVPAFAAIRTQIACNRCETDINVTTLQTRDTIDSQPVVESLVRYQGRTRPKPTVHPQHHFADATRAA